MRHYSHCRAMIFNCPPSLNEPMSESLRQKHRITHMLTLSNTYFQTEHRHDLVLVVRQDGNEDFYSYFYEAVDYLHSVLMRQGKVLMHCILEISRGTISVAAYLSKTGRTNFSKRVKT
ncbi:uncharacterized protein BT62DRAFT_1071513 [Guyanagaster necrorhizus]|uniref:Dual specificity phosphatase catalytic domain-containing protein n=1 Tax=Guyanagaster necrorhizus TaxID=856835 RepID=A0A9P7W576_9AGAR|nr:uncharacterized protein BT62DRAFT_1071513 [Guyanagaster necrorhizus MCA 3950]KAG7452367.1 hypothetical protein BT62DRAFT_1071513 [Guyanagaster necrorhizus MCA 3950]